MSHDAVYLHVGAPKTGTTYLQEFLWTNRDRLPGAGLLYPGDKAGRQFLAVLDLQGTGFAGNEMSDVQGSWATVTEQAQAWHGRTVISHELLAGLTPEQIETALASLAPRPVHVVLTLRDLSRIVPATWQEDAKNRYVESWPDYLARVRPSEGRRDPKFWRLQDVASILERWSAHLPAERVHVVTVPPAGAPRQLLLQRFSEVVGFDPADFKQDVKVANDSIGSVEVALLHRLNRTSVERLSWPAYHHSIKHFGVPKVLAVRPDALRVTLPDSEMDWVRDETRRAVRAIKDLGAEVVGDLDDLSPRPDPAEYVDPTSVRTEQELDAALDLTAGLATRLYETSNRLRNTRLELAAAVETLHNTRTERTKRRIVALGRRNRGVDAVLNVYRNARRRRR